MTPDAGALSALKTIQWIRFAPGPRRVSARVLRELLIVARRCGTPHGCAVRRVPDRDARVNHYRNRVAGRGG